MQTKFIWASKHQNSVYGADAMSDLLSQSIRFGDPLLTSIDSSFINSKFHLDDDLIIRNFPPMGASTVDYLDFIEKYVPEDLISQNNFSQLKNLAGNFAGGLTSFFGFESCLDSPEPQTDYLIAISSEKGERDALVNLIKNRNLPEVFHDQSEWKQVSNFALKWADPKSKLYNNVLGLWFEFDMASSSSEFAIPGVFIHTIPIHASSINESLQHRWLINTAIPLLMGKRLSHNVEQQILDCIKMMPSEASIYQVGVMLSRPINGIRLVIKRINLDQIAPYLKSVGWSDNQGRLAPLLEELQHFVNRIVLHITVAEKVDPKIGIECSFYPDIYHQETRWNKFLKYLKKKDLCISDKYSSLLDFPGVQHEKMLNYFDLGHSMPITKMTTNSSSRAVVRFISHIKIIYQPNCPIEAKAYYGVRVLGSSK